MKKSINNTKLIDFSIALAFGVIIMIMVTDLIPECLEIFGRKNILTFIVCTIIGFIILRILDMFIPDHDDDPETGKDNHNNLVHIGFVSSIALILHNIIEGMAIYSTFTSSLSLGIMVSIGVGLHNIPLGMVITSTIYQDNNDEKKTFLIVSLLSLSTFVGGLIIFLLGENLVGGTFLGSLLAITLGMLTYICFCELFPKLLHSKNKLVSILGVLIGVLLLSVTLFF